MASIAEQQKCHRPVRYFRNADMLRLRQPSLVDIVSNLLRVRCRSDWAHEKSPAEAGLKLSGAGLKLSGKSGASLPPERKRRQRWINRSGTASEPASECPES
jgi:hypothetical protein